MQKLIQAGDMRDDAYLARLGQMTRAGVSQIMDLLLLAPDIQEAILALPAVLVRLDMVSERQLRPIVAVADWGKQRKLWAPRP